MARIRQDDVEAVRERNDIAAVIGQYVALKKAGRDLVGLCPFHTEKTPSFRVEPGKQVFYCFGCGKGGNVFHFLMEIEQLTFPESVERLASRAGITLRYEGVSEKDRREMSRRKALYRANAKAAELYRKMLLEGREAEDARRYLSSRGISKDSVETFGIGYAPGYHDFLLRRMAREFSPEILVEAGLAIQDDRGQVRDRFRARVMFPVHDLAGQAVGFGARLLEGDGPKYLNSPETAVYKKGEMLYNLDRAKVILSSEGRVFVTEGYTDVIGLHQGGIPAAVATCGTALGEGHFRLLARFATTAYLAFDSDEAGARAAERAHGFFERYPLDVRVLILPEGQDPADLVKERGPEAFAEHAERAVPLIEYMLRRSVEGKETKTPEGQARAVAEAVPILEGLGDPVLRSRYAGVLADLVGTRTDTEILRRLERSGGGLPQRAEGGARPRASRSPEREVEREALKLLLQHPDGRGVDKLRTEHFTNERHRKLFELARSAPDSGPADLMERTTDSTVARLIAELAVESPMGDPGEGYGERVSWRLEEFSLSRQIDAMKKRLERLNALKETEEFDSLYESLITLEAERRKVRQAAEGA
ncbi:MAG TPA: DNA primase [Actinomycetota bacterium]|nr:DNA primase [Actinomycetota bacterium]